MMSRPAHAPASASDILDELLAAWGGEVLRRPAQNTRSARFALLHPTFGVALLDVAPDDHPDALQDFLARYRDLLPPDAPAPPVIYRAVQLRDLWRLTILLDAAFAAAPPLNDPNASWLPTARTAFLQPEAQPTLQPEAPPAAKPAPPTPSRPPPVPLHGQPEFAPRPSRPAPARAGWIAAGLLLPLVAGAGLLARVMTPDRSPMVDAREEPRATPAAPGPLLASFTPAPSSALREPRPAEDGNQQASEVAAAREPARPAAAAPTAEETPAPAEEAPGPSPAETTAPAPADPSLAEAGRPDGGALAWFAPLGPEEPEPEPPAPARLEDDVVVVPAVASPPPRAGRPPLSPAALAWKAKVTARAAKPARTGIAGVRAILVASSAHEDWPAAAPPHAPLDEDAPDVAPAPAAPPAETTATPPPASAAAIPQDTPPPVASETVPPAPEAEAAPQPPSPTGVVTREAGPPTPPASDEVVPPSPLPAISVPVPAPAAVEPTTAAAPAAPPVRPAAPPRAAPTMPPEALAGLVRRGDAMLGLGDVSAARLLYERAAAGGSVAAAIALARTYDPAVLASLGVRGLRPDPEAAAAWYRRAAEMSSAATASSRGARRD